MGWSHVVPVWVTAAMWALSLTYLQLLPLSHHVYCCIIHLFIILTIMHMWQRRDYTSGSWCCTQMDINDDTENENRAGERSLNHPNGRALIPTSSDPLPQWDSCCVHTNHVYVNDSDLLQRYAWTWTHCLVHRRSTGRSWQNGGF